MPFNLIDSGQTQQQTDENKARAIAAKMNAGQPVSPTDVRWLYGKGYGGMAQSSPYTSNKASPYTSMSGANFVQPAPTPSPTPNPTPSPVKGDLKPWDTTDIKAKQLNDYYANKYALPTTPVGWGISSFKETSTGLNIEYRLTDIEAAFKAGTLPADTEQAYRKSKADEAANTQKWAALGYGGYGGKYVAPDVPSGFKIGNITEGASGLSIQYEPTNILGYMTLSKEGIVKPQKANVLDYIRASKEPMVLRAIRASGEGLVTPTKVSVLDYIKEANKPMVLRAISASTMGAAQKPNVLDYIRAERTVTTREPNILDYIVESRKPMVLRALSGGLLPGPTNILGAIQTAKVTGDYNASVAFYSKIGYPQYGGRYAPFKVPFPLVLLSLKETVQGPEGPWPTPRLVAGFGVGTWTEYAGKPHEPTVWENVESAIGNWLAQDVEIGGPPSFTIQGKKVSFGADYGVHMTRGEAGGLAAVIALPFAAPVALPFLGLSTIGILASAGVSVGVSEVFSRTVTITDKGISLGITDKDISLSQAINAALVGEALTIGSSAILKGASKISPIFTRSIRDAMTQSGIGGAAVSVASRAAIFSAFGAGTGFALSGGDIKQAEIGAISGAAFSVGGDIFKYGVERGYIPIPKYGSVKVPFEIQGQEGEFYADQPTWRGLYLSRGTKASLLLGKFSDIPESLSPLADIEGPSGKILTHGMSGEEAGWKPVSNIESAVTLEAMSEMGYNPQTIEDFAIARDVMGVTQYTKSKFIEDMLPSKTGTLSEEGVSNLKDYILKNKSQASELFGRFGTNPQLSTEFEYTLNTPSGDVISALRDAGDIDIQLKTSDLEAASKYTSGALKVLQDAGDIVRISPEKPTLIEANVGGKWAHAVDIKYEGMPDTQLSAEGGWGFKYSRPTTEIEGLPAMSLSEQSLRKGADSFLGFTEDMGMGPVTHRMKDIPDWVQAEQTLLKSSRLSGKVVEAQGLLSGLAERYNVNLADLPPIGESYIVSGRSTVFQSTPIIASPLISTLSDAPSYSIGKTMASPSKLVASIKTSATSLTSIPTSTPKLITNMMSSMSSLSPKKSSGASSIYGSVSRLVSPSSYASKIEYSPPTSFSRQLSPLSMFNKSTSKILSVSSIGLSPSISLSKMFSYPSSLISSKNVSPKPSYPSYPKSYSSYPSSYPSLSSSPPSSPYPSISLTSISPPITKNPRLPVQEFKKSKNRFGRGEWFKRSHPILEPKQVFSQFWGGSLSKANLKTQKLGIRKTKRSKRSMEFSPITEERLQIFTPGREYTYNSGWVKRSKNK